MPKTLPNNRPVPPAAGAAPFEQAVQAWTRALGDPHVKRDDATLDRYARTTGTQSHRPVAVLYPDSPTQVQDILRTASAHGVGVYPISRGKNWGYGDAAAMRPNQVIVDLGRMNRILEVNTELCYAVVEPGVTQEQLHRYLEDNQTGLWMDSSGAGRAASIVGNVLERGFGHTRYGDHCLTTCGMQVVLADGRVVNTGLGHYPNAKARHVYRYGVGPFIDGLFTQSNFGVVTRMGVWLMPKPENFCAFFLFADDERALEDLVPRLAALRMQGIVQSTVHIANDLRVISGKAAYPWERTGGKTPLPDDVRAALRSEYAIGAWNVAGALYGSRETVAAARKTIRRALPNYRVAFLDDRRLAAAERLHRLLSKVGLGHALGEKLESVRPVFGLLKGVPTDEPMRGASWRVRGPAPAQPADPLDRNAGLLWIAPVLPATAADARAVVTLVDPIYRKHGFETLVTFTLITERAMVCVTNVSFDRRDADETARARACYDELSHRLMDEGYVPYRSGPAGMAALDPHADTFWDVTSRIKHALDPDGIIAPGRYDPRAA